MRWCATILLAAGALAAQTGKPAPPRGTVHGVVRDAAGDPAPDIKVGEAAVATGGNVIQVGGSTTTDETGSYSLKLPAGAHSLWVDRGPTRVAGKQIRLDADQELTVDFVIPVMPVVRGRVLNQDKEPVVDAFVFLLEPQLYDGVLRPRLIGPKVTNADGSYEFDSGLEPNRRYLVLVDMPPPDEIVRAVGPEIGKRQPIEVPTYYPSAV